MRDFDTLRRSTAALIEGTGCAREHSVILSKVRTFVPIAFRCLAFTHGFSGFDAVQCHSFAALFPRADRDTQPSCAAMAEPEAKKEDVDPRAAMNYPLLKVPHHVVFLRDVCALDS